MAYKCIVPLAYDVVNTSLHETLCEAVNAGRGSGRAFYIYDCDAQKTILKFEDNKR